MEHKMIGLLTTGFVKIQGTSAPTRCSFGFKCFRLLFMVLVGCKCLLEAQDDHEVQVGDAGGMPNASHRAVNGCGSAAEISEVDFGSKLQAKGWRLCWTKSRCLKKSIRMKLVVRIWSRWPVLKLRSPRVAGGHAEILK